MTEQIEIGGAKRPVRFGWAGLYEYEQQTGRKPLADFAEMASGGVSIVVMVDLVFYGLCAGYRHEQKNTDFTKYDVADWIGESPEVLTKVMSVFSKAFPTEGNAKAGKPAKVVATPLQ